MKNHDKLDQDTAEQPTRARKPYNPPRIEKRQAVARVTLLSGMGAVSVGVISVMN